MYKVLGILIVIALLLGVIPSIIQHKKAGYYTYSYRELEEKADEILKNR